MRLEIEVTDYDTAADALLGANQCAAIAFDALRSSLRGYDALGGDDASSEDFVRSYDAAAAEAVDTLHALVDALGTLSAATRASAAHHRAADAASVVGRTHPYEGGSPGHEPVTVAAFTPPTALGGDDTDTPDWWNHVVDHLQGFGWPSADTAQLRSAASAWRRAAGSVDALPRQLSTAATHLEQQRSPEIAVAVTVLRDTGSQVADLADCLRGLGDACEDYADQVEETRDTIRGLLRDLAVECGVTAGIGLALSVVTLGGSAAVGTGVVAFRAAKYAHRILVALRALRAARAVLTISKRMAEMSRLRRAFEHLRSARKLATFRQGPAPKFIGAPKQVQAKFKHARDFGVPGNYSKASAARFERTLDDFVNHPATKHRQGVYHGRPVQLSYNTDTGQVVVADYAGHFVSGWKMSYSQLQHVIRTGSLGGPS